MDILDEKFAITAFIAGLGIQSKDLMFSISKNPQASMAEVLAKAEKYINGEEALMSKRGSSSAERRKSRMRKSETEALGDEETETDPHEGEGKIDIDLQREEVTSRTAWVHPSLSCSHGTHLSSSPPLTASVSQVLYEVQHEKFLRWSSQMKTNPAKRDITKYCDFHRDHGHQTDECIQF